MTTGLEVQIVEKNSPAYPKEWLSIADAPERVYAVGNLALLGARKLTTVGSRRTPTQACALGKEIAKELSRYFALATGVAEGGDSALIEGALVRVDVGIGDPFRSEIVIVKAMALGLDAVFKTVLNTKVCCGSSVNLR